MFGCGRNQNIGSLEILFNIVETLKILSRTCYCVITGKKRLLHWGKDGSLLLDSKDAWGGRGGIGDLPGFLS